MAKFLEILNGLKQRFFPERTPPLPPFFMNKNAQYAEHEIGDFTYGRPDVYQWDDKTKLKIGKFCSIASNTQILLGGNHRTDWISTFPFGEFLEFQDPQIHHYQGHPSSKGDIVIGNDVWIGHGVTILSGVTIGDGACIGAHSVVSKNIPPYAIAVGNPIRVLKYRFEEPLIQDLLQLKWWDWDLGRIKENIPLLLSGDLETFLKKNGVHRQA